MTKEQETQIKNIAKEITGDVNLDYDQEYILSKIERGD